MPVYRSGPFGTDNTCIGYQHNSYPAAGLHNTAIGSRMLMALYQANALQTQAKRPPILPMLDPGTGRDDVLQRGG